MWKFWQKPIAMPLSDSMTLYLGKERGLSQQNATPLRVLEQRGRYSGRKVNFFRVFDPATGNAGRPEVSLFDNLDVRRVLYSGHTENDGQIVLDAQR